MDVRIKFDYCSQTTTSKDIDMFNIVTSDHLQSTPSVEGIDSARIPQILSKVYAHILSLKTKYQEGELEFEAREIAEDYHLLRKMAFTLELYLESGRFDTHLKAITFVAAMAHKLMTNLRQQNSEGLSLDCVPSDLVTVLLFTIGGYFADAEEAVQNVKYSNEYREPCRQLVYLICQLIKGRLQIVIDVPLAKPDTETLDTFAEDLMWIELSKGIKVLSASLLGRTDDDYTSFFQRVTELSVTKDEEQKIRYASVGPNRLSKLLLFASETLKRHSVVNAITPYIENLQHQELLYRIANRRPYLWDNHLDAIQNGFMNIGTSSVVTFPTGAGKSTLIDLKVMQAVARGGRVVYIVPTHALENQVKNSITDLIESEEYKYLNIGREFTMEETEDLPVLVMTPERCSTLLALNPDYFEGVTLVIMDEFHIISNSSHRSLGAMFCLISLFSIVSQADFVLVSAMVENGKEVAGWISRVTGRNCLDLSMKWKPTSQLQGCIVYMNDEAEWLQHLCNVDIRRGQKSPSVKLKRSLKATPYCMFSLCNTWESNHTNDYYLTMLLDNQVHLGVGRYWNLIGNRNEVSMELAKKFSSIGMKTIIFVENPDQANSIVKRLNTELETKEIPSKIRKRLSSIIEELGSESLSYVNIKINAVQHHGRLLPEERVIMESLFRQKSDIMVATPTLAQGINLPVDVVIIAGEDRFDAETGRRRELEAHEILNAAGRAGRAGFRSQGAAILVPNSVITVKDNHLDNSWFRLKDEIFSKGDQCLKVEDPFEALVESVENDEIELTTEQKLILLKLNLQDENKQDVLRQTFRAYQLRDDQKSLDEFVNRLLSISSDTEKEKSPLLELSFKCGIEQDVLAVFYEWLKYNIPKKDTIEGILDFYFEWLSQNPSLFEQLLVFESTTAELSEMLQVREHLNDEAIMKLHHILQMYIRGDQLKDISQILARKRNEIYIGTTRRFVLKILPDICYALSVLSMVYIQYLRDSGEEDIDIPYGIKNFATCLKEGVTSEDMLKFKIQKRLMRVETHRLFNERRV